MSTTMDLTEDLIGFLRDYYRDEIGTLAQRFPNEQRSIEVDYSDLYQHDRDIAEDYLVEPGQMQEYLDEALRLFDLPADIDLSDATVRVVDLPDGENGRTFYPGHYSPTTYAGEYLSIKGEVVLASDVRPKIVEAAFECQRCGTMTYLVQTDNSFQEPHECQACERQGPFRVNFDESAFVDSQTLRVQEPPSVAGGGGRDLTVNLEGELTDEVGVGDKVVVSGTLHLEQRTQGNQKTPQFGQYLDGRALQVSETDYRSLDISSEERQEIQRLAAGEEGDPLELAAESLTTKILGYDHIKKAIVLALVGGHRVTGGDGDSDRGDFHVLMLGDPGTAKSKLGGRAGSIAPRAVGVSGKNATEAGITASAVRDEVNDNQWTLDPGAFVKANGGLVWIDELDDMSPDVRASLLEPMSNQTINVNKAGINANLQTQTAVIAAGNPKYGRFDPYEPVAQQFEFDSALLSRFDLIFTLSDKPDPDEDIKVIRHMSEYRETAKRLEVDPDSLTEAQRQEAAPPVSEDLFAKWIALAKQQPAPLVEDPTVRAEKEQAFADLRAANGYDQDSPVPTTFRKWEGVYRIAEAAAKFELSETLDQRHFEIAMELVGQSMQDYGKDEDGNLDTDIQETGESKSQKQKIRLLEETVQELEAERDNVEVRRQDVVDALEDDLETGTVHGLLDKAYERGWLVKPDPDTVRWIGRY